MAEIKINGKAYDTEKPCEVCQALKAAKIRMATGENVQELSVQSPITRQTVVYGAANMAALDGLIREYQTACEATTTGKRTRFAKRMRFC
ncbi:hypothetical protein HDIA_1980 [Hartmannibacter diazotrophicus]|uniref:Uncharacterized protein n=1 Tax=Hartmannibacter diazotrophicus TaxID=1482074 RepID=A0A2C9D6Z2_9HYPH|nr:hypothetical protein [Hartmannibacter diazotrophicus]SON55521.1 hypothetical protein HDIA_1980 [Hartmannibacter diazotrophicus]